LTSLPRGFAGRIVAWQGVHGRHDLPWQGTRDPYRIWLSEVMLQQTQVATVVGYFNRFVARFPDVGALARADLDEVMGLWSGLGYYSRARHLHRCAQQVVERWRGVFPRDAHDLASLPGIGRSTAAAIASLCHGGRVAILDANVRRVLVRVLAFDADPLLPAGQRRLWDVATALLPRRDLQQTMPRYTQGMMDLGATVCLPRRPACTRCPVQTLCKARQSGDPHAFAVRSRKPARGGESIWLLWLRSPTGAVWLRRRPAPGVWAGLHCLPWFDSHQALRDALPAASRATLRALPVVEHALTHKDLFLHPLLLDRSDASAVLADGQWFDQDAWPRLGLPAPVRRLLAQPP